MIAKQWLCVLALAVTAAPITRLAAQVQTDAPPVVPGAKPVATERIRIHGASLEGNLAGEAVDREAIIFLPPSYDVLAKWTANAPLAFIDQYIMHLRRYRGIALDVGDQDGLRTDTARLHDVLDKYRIENSFDIYAGTHTSAVADRFQNHVLPFFSKHLCFGPRCSE